MTDTLIDGPTQTHRTLRFPALDGLRIAGAGGWSG